MKIRLGTALLFVVASMLLCASYVGAASGWNSIDIGPVAAPGSSSETDGVFIIKGSGEDIYSVADDFHYMYRPFSGDGEIVAYLASMESTVTSGTIGVMFRESLDANSRHVILGIIMKGNMIFKRRYETNGMTVNTATGGRPAPRWLKLVRSGEKFSAYYSDDGQTWQLHAEDEIEMGKDIYVGLAACVQKNGELVTGTLQNVTITNK